MWDGSFTDNIQVKRTSVLHSKEQTIIVKLALVERIT